MFTSFFQGVVVLAQAGAVPVADKTAAAVAVAGLILVSLVCRRDLREMIVHRSIWLVPITVTCLVGLTAMIVPVV